MGINNGMFRIKNRFRTAMTLCPFAESAMHCKKKQSAVPDTGGRHTSGTVTSLGPQSKSCQTLSGCRSSTATFLSATLERKLSYSLDLERGAANA